MFYKTKEEGLNTRYIALIGNVEEHGKRNTVNTSYYFPIYLIGKLDSPYISDLFSSKDDASIERNRLLMLL